MALRSRVGRDRAYAPSIPELYNTLKRPYTRSGYYVRVTGTTAATALIEGLPCRLPRNLTAPRLGTGSATYLKSRSHQSGIAIHRWAIPVRVEPGQDL